MNFNPNAMMQKQVERMISQRFGSVDNMMNDTAKPMTDTARIAGITMIPKMQIQNRRWTVQ